MNDGPAYEVSESTVFPGKWGWALWAPVGASASACVMARPGFDSPAEAMKDLNRFKAIAASAVVLKPGKQPRRKAS